MMMDMIWHILLTACLGNSCVEQDVQWFETREECEAKLPEYLAVPPDQNWTSVTYQCKPLNSLST